MGKKKRQSIARDLPQDFTRENEIPKYVTYNVEYNKKNDVDDIHEIRTIKRDYWTVDHPKEGKRWYTSKSSKFSINEKFDEAVKHVNYINSLP
jgi:hypothetical protein